MNLDILVKAFSEEERRKMLGLLQKQFCHPANTEAIGNDGVSKPLGIG